MVQHRTAKEVQGILAACLKTKIDLGFWNSILNLVLDPCNPFEPGKRREPRKDFVLAVVLVGMPLAAFVCFNFWS